MPLHQGVPLYGNYSDVGIILQTVTPPCTEDTAGALCRWIQASLPWKLDAGQIVLRNHAIQG
jgi:hypothetical protein